MTELLEANCNLFKLNSGALQVKSDCQCLGFIVKDNRPCRQIIYLIRSAGLNLAMGMEKGFVPCILELTLKRKEKKKLAKKT